MFALVADIERYPEFVPSVIAAKVLKSEENTIFGQLEMERGGLREKFTTSNDFEAPTRMSLALVEGPFRLLDGLWTFEALGERGTKIRLTIRFEFKNPITRCCCRARSRKAAPRWWTRSCCVRVLCMSEPEIAISVAYALPDRQTVVKLNVPAGTTVGDAVRLSSLSSRFPELATQPLHCAIFGRVVAQ